MPTTGRGLVGANLHSCSDVHVEVGEPEGDRPPITGRDLEDHMVGGGCIREPVELLLKLADGVARDGEAVVHELCRAIPVKLHGCTVQQVGEFGHGHSLGRGT